VRSFWWNLRWTGVAAEINQRVVHPPHVPLEGETEAAEVRRARDLRPGGGFFGNGHNAGEFGVGGVVEFADEIDGFEIFAATELVGNPLAFFAGVVEVEHGGHSIHAEAVDVMAFAPEQCIGDEEILHLVTAKIEDECAPVLMLAFARVLVFVESGAIETCERPVIAGEMGGNPIDDDADAGLVKGVDDELEILGWPVTTGGSVKAGHLVTPGWIKGVFGDGKEFDVGESHLLDVSDERFSEFTVAEGFAGRFFAPGADMDFVNAERRAKDVLLAATGEPVIIAPGEFLCVPDDGGVFGRGFEEDTVRIGVELDVPLASANFVLVMCAFGDARYEYFPNTGLTQ